MSLIGALHVGRTGLAVSQAALEVAGNNLANAGTDGYTRQTASLAAGAGVQVGPGVFIGTGVRLQSIIRHVDEALNTRYRASISDQSAAQTHAQLLSQIESVEGELTDQSLSGRLDEFFNTWNQLAGNPGDDGLRSLVVSQGRSLASFIQQVHTDLTNLRTQVDDSLRNNVTAANGLLERIATINAQIVVSEQGKGSGANELRDQRDQLLKELSTYMDISTVQQPSGSVDVFVNSIPVVLGAKSRGVELKFETEDNQLNVKLRVTADGSPLAPDSGAIGQLLSSRAQDVSAAIENINEFAAQLIFQVNRVHASGQGVKGFTSLAAGNVVVDAAAALDSAEAGLSFTPVNGSFQVHVRQKSTSATTTTLINVDLDGIGADTSLNDLAAQLSAAGLTATVNAEGRLNIATASSDYELKFSGDSSGVLAALGLNSFFTGATAGDISMNATLVSDPGYLATTQNNVTGGNANALAMSRLVDEAKSELGGLSLRDFWRRHVEDYAVRGDQATQSVEASTAVTDGLKTQRESVSGVSMDEEAINLLMFQRAYQGSARFISAVDQMMETLMGLVR